MKKILMMLSLVVISLFIFGCTKPLAGQAIKAACSSDRNCDSNEHCAIGFDGKSPGMCCPINKCSFEPEDNTCVPEGEVVDLEKYEPISVQQYNNWGFQDKDKNQGYITLTCTGGVWYDSLFCSPNNDKLDRGEQCDNYPPRNDGYFAKNCFGLGYDGGQIICAPNCKLDTSKCGPKLVQEVAPQKQEVPKCGNDQLDYGEECDSPPDNSGFFSKTCNGLGFDGGRIACTAYCKLDTSGCNPKLPVCGNNIKEGSEVCDGSDLAGQTCVSKGFVSGTLSCSPYCSSIYTDKCVVAAPKICTPWQSVCHNETGFKTCNWEGTGYNVYSCTKGINKFGYYEECSNGMCVNVTE